jgi:hypothetical protein
MKKFAILATVFILLVSIAIRLYAVSVPEGVFSALKSGNAKELAKFFNTNIELAILDKEDIYSKTQAEVIVADFFKQNPVTGYSTVHQGGKEGSQYVIGNLTTSKGTYRVYIYVKEVSQKPVISQMRIEKGE